MAESQPGSVDQLSCGWHYGWPGLERGDYIRGGCVEAALRCPGLSPQINSAKRYNHSYLTTGYTERNNWVRRVSKKSDRLAGGCGQRQEDRLVQVQSQGNARGAGSTVWSTERRYIQIDISICMYVYFMCLGVTDI